MSAQTKTIDARSISTKARSKDLGLTPAKLSSPIWVPNAPIEFSESLAGENDPATSMRGSITIESAAIRLTDTILGYNEQDLEQTLRAIAADIGMAHIAYMRFAPDKSSDASLLTGARTYSIQWQTRYFLKQYIFIDPVLAQGSKAILPFDWEELPRDDPAIQAFFADAVNHGVGCNGISVPVRNRRGAYSVVSFTSNHSRPEWEVFKKNNMVKLQLISVLIDSAASVNLKLSSPPVKLSKREEQCLIWAARGKTYQDISDILNISFGSVKSYLDTARHKLNCANLTHAVGVAIATGVIPAKALQGSAFK
jgi:LuxR family transcriptional regulator, quorum-sensing system regulator CinR